eukprot:CAMPEP_0168433324 /NCGR_PEP_ID=MMETSP0228-20121227/39342_1 /TAXON_ID=133427 /ORGANISM="Protoceratium reticulatum, Strain CCCM 535 (=CCMP 1889)" /LENGTH=252 /DNA_ID=CAMNT_0008447467 /DNA_START=103 /DNA_END=858 /DNA_ORIENTATION=+
MAGQAAHLLHVALSPVDLGKKTLDLLPIFPNAYSLCCALLFLAPVVKCIVLAFDPLVEHWLGDGPKIVMVLPVVFIGASHIIHMSTRTLRKRALVLSLIGPSLALGIQANRIAVKALQLGTTLSALDCQPYSLKHELEGEWKAAKDFHDSCADMRVQDCPGYFDHAVHHPGWRFLLTMEQTYACAGWCEPREPLWTAEHVNDSCSTVASQVLSGKILRDSMQVAIYNIVVLTLSTMVLITMAPSLQSEGMEW